MKKFTLLMVMMCLFTLGAKAQDATTVLIGDLYYTLDEANLTAETAAMPKIGEGDEAIQPRYEFATVTVPATIVYDGKTYDVVKIGNGSLRELPNLTTITIPASVQTIGNSSFAQCPNLTMVVGSNNASVIEDWAFYGCEKMSFFIPSPDLKAVTEHCFQNCTSLGAFNIPSGATEIRTCAFQGCAKLSNVTIPSTVTTIDPWSFYGTGVKSITIPEGVVKLAAWTFGECTAIETLKLPASMTNMEDWVFDKVTTLKEIYVAWPIAPDPNDPEAAITGVKWWTFGDQVDRSACIVKVPEQYREAYGETWFDFPVQTYVNGIATIAIEQARVQYAEGTLKLFNLDGYAVNIVSVNGQRVAAFTANTTDMPLSLASGVYVLKATKGDKIAIAKFIVK